MHLSDDFIVMTANIDDCPCVKIPLTELFDVATFTLIDNYLEVFYQYVVELLEDTAWMDLQSFSRLSVLVTIFTIQSILVKFLRCQSQPYSSLSPESSPLQ
jgi:hypothetical protein